MLDSMYVAATGMLAEQRSIDVVANNLANLNTPAFKKQRAVFNEMLQLQQVNSKQNSVLTEGNGVAIAQNQTEMTAGELKATERSLDIAITGKGFFELELANGAIAYTRNGSLKLDNKGYLTTQSGHLLADRIQIPPDSKTISISEQGQVTALVDQELIELGQLQLVSFMSESGLDAHGNGIYTPTDKAGAPYYSMAGENGTGKIQQGFLETSNVELTDELMWLTLAQRGYEANAQVIRAADNILRITNNLRGN
ncbi:flagellar hook-basal body protein [Spartinivicinus ruber]|uniref:flagellar hook-basal body protein n=1 Tax=Spartinivicinus ruber TaxID=2683272 RepID=UPI0013D2A147|nr:flagellar hook-basal body complex protein [Spartinivicinus ruber]